MTGSIRVLCVGDRWAPTGATSLERVDERIETSAVTGAEAARERLEADAIDCLVSEYRLPETDGLAFLDQILSEWPELPCFLVTEPDAASVVERALDAGVTDCLSKDAPAQVHLLANRVINVVESDSERRVAAQSQAGDRPQGSGDPPQERERDLERYRTLIEEVTDIVTVIDEHGVIHFQSRSVEPVLGYEPTELEGQNAFDLVHPDDRDRVAAHLHQLRAEPGTTLQATYRMRDADGAWRWLESNGSNRTETAFDGYVITSRDVTERKRREDALGALHEATRAFMDAPDRQQVADRAVETARSVLDMPINGLWLYDPVSDALEPTAVTDAAVDLIDEVPTYQAGESISWEAFETGEIRVYEDLDAENGLLNPETPIESELVLPLGEYGVMNLGATTRQAFDEIDVWLARILANTTESALARADREAQLRARRRELSRQNERLEAFASILSHDLRNPLTVLDGSLEFVGTDDDDAHRDRCGRAIDRMQQLVDDLLTLTRQSDTVETLEPLDLERVARESWQIVATEDASLAIEADCTIAADESRLRQLLENLFRNAVEHGSTSPDSHARQDAVEHGSTSSRPEADDAVEHGSTSPASNTRQDAVDQDTGTANGDEITRDGGAGLTVTVGCLDDGPGFFVADDGPGIPESDRDRLFESGFSTSSNGTGLGLTIVEHSASAHGWAVDVTDSASGGARFEINGVETPS